MSRTLRNIKLGLDQSLEDYLSWAQPGHSGFKILRQSVDARQRHAPHFVYSVEVFTKGEIQTPQPIAVEPVSRYADRPVVIIGAGPAGLFAALRLGERGIPTILLEQGGPTSERIRSIARYWRYGELDPVSNVGFGEGGAGLFSDGKLITRIKSPYIPYVMQRLVSFGAPAEIEYLANPHVGSDRIRRLIPVMRARLQELGCSVRFHARVVELTTRDRHISGVRLNSGELIPCERVILACGHSAESLFAHLHDLGVHIEGKSFAVGLRIEHPQSLINQLQYREHAQHPKLGAANYKLAHHDKVDGVGVYSFCMCPGGYVLSAGTDPDGIVCNGMSNYHRGSPFANSALVVSLDHERHFASQTFGGLEFRRKLERDAYRLVQAHGARRELPAQRLVDFLSGTLSHGELPSSSPSGVVSVRLDQLLTPEMRQRIIASLRKFESDMPGFISDSAVLHGVESRTSCPIRITRNDATLQSLSHPGLYPCGEGAGYAGGITSAACDGIRVAETIASEVANAQPQNGLTEA